MSEITHEDVLCFTEQLKVFDSVGPHAVKRLAALMATFIGREGLNEEWRMFAEEMIDRH